MKKIAIALACLIALGAGSVALAEGGFGPGKHFAKIDANADGKVTKAEHARAAEERFTRMDENKDGVLTVDELKHGRGPRGGHGHGHGRGHGPGGECDHDHAGKASQGKAPAARPATQGAAGSAGR